MTKPSVKDLSRLVGNRAAYAVQHDDGSWHPVREPLTAAVLRQHLAEELTVGTYIVVPPSSARTLVFDIDAEGQERYLQTTGILTVLEDLGLGKHLAMEDSGRKGAHIWVVAEEYMPAATLYRLGRGVRSEAGYENMEVFPKQTEVRDLGNLVKLPGGVHRVTGNQNNFMTDPPVPVPVGTLEALAAKYPEVGVRMRKGDAPETVAFPCTHDIQGGVQEGGRNTHLFHLATMLRRMSLTEENLLTVMQRANERSTPPLGDQELADIIENSRYSGPICGQLDDDKHCGEQCILTKHGGLYTRPGALKWAQEGEIVTVEVTERGDGTAVTFAHPDIVTGRAVLIEAPRRKHDGD